MHVYFATKDLKLSFKTFEATLQTDIFQERKELKIAGLPSQ